ncbi:MAG: hypothetical protein EBZ67_00455 [Chitinophagia bacterium]|nr:hypothetical protein [Chitinophagia bacterium]
MLSLMTDGLHRVLVLLMFFTTLVSLLNRIGNGIALRESIALMYIITCLLMPIFGYDFYNVEFYPARVIDFVMQVPEQEYYSYVLPAVSAFCFALTFPLPTDRAIDELPGMEVLMQRCQYILEKDNIGVFMIFAGVISFLLTSVLPAAFHYVGVILFFSSFTGLLYIFYTPNRENKRPLMISFAIFLIVHSIFIAMFTIIIYMGITIASFFLLRTRIAFFKKLGILTCVVFLVIVLQFTKGMYRKIVYESDPANKVELFTTLYVQNLQAGTDLFRPEAFWSVYMRVNQGLIISNVMERFPKIKPFDNGEILLTSIFASFIPRFIWEDKSTADGRFNMTYFAGRTLNKNTSMNVGPIGEAYGSFGPTGGIAFMFLIGMFVRLLYGWVLQIALRIPLVIMWLPVLFFNITFSAETDTMQILNSSIKVSFLMWVIYMAYPRWFGVRRQTLHERRVELSRL